MPVREFGRVCGGKGPFAGLARGEVLPQRQRRGRRQRGKERVRHAPQGLEVVDDAGQLLGEPGVLSLDEIERGEPGDAADELAVDLHGGEYSQRLDAPLGAPLPSPSPVTVLPEALPALRRLSRRRTVRLARRASAVSGVPFLLVGGAVRDALLGLAAGDVDLAVPREGAASFAAALARLGGSRALIIGQAPRRILHVPLGSSSVDVWETDGDPATDLLRRDFTINALGLAFPGGRLVAPDGALDDLRARRLRLPRTGVLLEDPLRVVRAARFLARLPGFRLDPAALPELLQAARGLLRVAPERRLSELDAILATGPGPAALALARLETWGALEALLPGVPRASRRRGARLVGAAGDGTPAPLLRTILLSPAGPASAAAALEALRASRRDRRLAETLLGLPRPPRKPGPRDAVLLLRRAAPFSREAVVFCASARGGGRTGSRTRGRAPPRRARGPPPAPATPPPGERPGRRPAPRRFGERAGPRPRPPRRGARHGSRPGTARGPGVSRRQRSRLPSRVEARLPVGISFVRGSGTWT